LWYASNYSIQKHTPAQDRFFAWCDPRLIDQVEIGAAAHQFAVENNPGLFHPASSWKQIEFGEANVQLTFHEGDKQTIGDVECIMVEPDIDYFRDLGAHAIFEVIPNAITHSLTNPVPHATHLRCSACQWVWHARCAGRLLIAEKLYGRESEIEVLPSASTGS
jgi:hypothetical protein